MMLVVFANNKGGVGKTTAATNTAVGLSRKGLHTLLVDFDEQGNVAGRFAVEPGPSVKRYMSQEWPIAHCVQPAQNDRRSWPSLDLMVGSDETKTAIANILNELRAGTSLQFYKDRLLALAQQYDAVVIDCRSGTVLTEIALLSADMFVIPTEMAEDSIAGMRLMKEQAHAVGLTTADIFVLPSRYDGRNKLEADLLQEVRQEKDAIVLDPIRNRIGVREAENAGVDLWTHPKARDAAADLAPLIAFVAARVRRQGDAPAPESAPIYVLRSMESA